MEHTVSKKVSPIPRGYRTATPCLTVVDIDSAVAFYQAAFGAELLTRQAGSDEVTAVHASIKVGNSIIILNRELPEQGLFAPVSLGGGGGQLHLYVDDVDISWARAVEAGAGIRVELHDAYWGDRTGILVDGNGHLWSMASRIENVSQQEITRRGLALTDMGPVESDMPLAETPLTEAVLAGENLAV